MIFTGPLTEVCSYILVFYLTVLFYNSYMLLIQQTAYWKYFYNTVTALNLFSMSF